ncbi:MAG: hypothetical protein MJZ23_00830 [Paludibacteraceae bacterium]|nr:hypothetical protein [Paludibacteraceae bacterium]
MKQLKHIICTLLLTLTFSPANAGELYGKVFDPSYRITVDSREIANEFYISNISDYLLICLLEDIEEQETNKHDSTGTKQADALEPSVSTPQTQSKIEEGKAYIIDTKKLSSEKLKEYVSGRILHHTTTGKVTFKKGLIVFHENESRFLVYFPSKEKIYISQEYRARAETLKFVTLTGDEQNPFKISTIPLKWILVIVLGIIFVPLMVFSASYTLENLEFNADKRSKNSIAIISLIFWILFCNSLVYTYGIWAILTFPFFAFPLFCSIFLTHLHLKINGKRRFKRLFSFTLMQCIWIFLFTLIYYAFVHSFWETPSYPYYDINYYMYQKF